MAASARIRLSFKVHADFDIDLSELITAQQMQLAAETGLAIMKRRITLQHRRADGRLFKKYSTEPIAVSTKAKIGTGNPFLRPRGGITSKSGKTMKFPGGYEELRAKAGRTTTQKDFTISGNTTGKRFRVLRADHNSAVIGWPAGSTQALVAKRLDDSEDGELFAFGPNEQEGILRTVAYFVSLALAKQGWAEAPPALELKDLE